MGGLVGSHTLTIGRGCQGNRVVQRVESAPIIGGWVPGDGDTVRSNGGEGQVLWSTRRGWGRGGVGGEGVTIGQGKSSVWVEVSHRTGHTLILMEEVSSTIMKAHVSSLL